MELGGDMKIEIVEVKGKMDYSSILDLINAEWPREFGEVTDLEKTGEMENSSNELDMNKFLFIDNKRIGWYRYSRWPREETNHDFAHTFDIVVLPEYKGQGFGKLLMNDMIDDCRKKGFKNLKSRTFLNNEDSIRLHQKCGFKEAFKVNDSIVWEINLNE